MLKHDKTMSGVVKILLCGVVVEKLNFVEMSRG